MAATEATTEVPATVSQRLLWMMTHYRSGFGSLSCPVLCRISGPLDPGALQAAVDGLVARHPALRTTFHGRGARLAQRFHAPRPLPLSYQDCEGADADAALAEELREPIDPAAWPARARLWRTSATEHLFCLNVHHLVTDAWSTGVLLRDLCALYDHATGGPDTLAAPGWSPARYAEWQQTLLDGDGLARHHAYWRRQLAGARLPRLAEGMSEPDSPATCDTLDFAPDVVTELRALAKREQTTLFTVLLTLFQLQLHRVTGENDLCVASMFANRQRPELRDSVLLSAGMVLLRARLARQLTFTELLRRGHTTVLSAFAHSDLPFQLLPSDLVDTGGGRADDVMFNVMTPTDHLRTSGGVCFELVVPTDIGSRFPFELALVPIGEDAMRTLLFRAPDRFGGVDGPGFLADLAGLASSVAGSPETTLSRL